MVQSHLRVIPSYVLWALDPRGEPWETNPLSGNDFGPSIGMGQLRGVEMSTVFSRTDADGPPCVDLPVASTDQASPSAHPASDQNPCPNHGHRLTETKKTLAFAGSLWFG